MVDIALEIVLPNLYHIVNPNIVVRAAASDSPPGWHVVLLLLQVFQLVEKGNSTNEGLPLLMAVTVKELVEVIGIEAQFATSVLAALAQLVRSIAITVRVADALYLDRVH